jgi:iron-sulfur cluster assembly accessory protein
MTINQEVNIMVNISDAAAAKSKEILKTEGKDGWGFRFFTSGSSCCGPSYGIDIVENAVDGDETLEKDGVKFYVDQTTLDSLKGMEIHFIDEGDKQGFVINNPNPPEAPSCGPSCGSSCG